MDPRLRGSCLGALGILWLASIASAQSSDTSANPPASQAPFGSWLPQSEAEGVLAALAAARAGNGGAIRAAMAGLSDPAARKIALWALADGAPQSLSFAEADAARRDLKGWPHGAKRAMAAERLLDRSGLAPGGVIAWFEQAAPLTAQGAVALAAALRATGQAVAAGEMIRGVWRSMVFDEDTQEVILARFGDVLTPADHLARADLLLYGAQGVAAQDMVRLLPPDNQAIALARIAVRRGDVNAASLVDALPFAAQTSPGLAYERVLRLLGGGQTDAALALIGYLPARAPNEAAAERLWRHGTLVVAALKAGDNARAYKVAATRASRVARKRPRRSFTRAGSPFLA